MRKAGQILDLKIRDKWESQILKASQSQNVRCQATCQKLGSILEIDMS
jgi:hypothetical protein